MALGFLTPDPRLRELSDLGLVLPGAKLNTYVSGTPSTPLATYSDSALTVPNTNPVVASTGGLFGPIYLTPGSAYKLVLTDSAGTVIWTQDPVTIPTPAGAVVLASPVSATGALDGQLLIGKTSDHTVNLATLTAGVGIQITNGAGTITIANGVLDRQVSLQTVANSVTETAVYTYAVPANTLGTNRTLKLSLIGDQLNNSGSPFTHTVRVKYGATTIFTLIMTGVPAGANRGAIVLDVELTAAGATGAQRAKGTLFMGDTNSNNTQGVAASIASGASNGSVTYAAHIAVAEDSTLSKNLVVTYQMNNASASEDMRAHTVYTEVK